MKNVYARKLSGLALVGGLCVGAYLLYGHYRYAEAKPIQYRTAEVSRGRVVSQVTATGTLEPRVTVQVGSQVSGRILALHADFNQQVTEGQLLAKLDPKLLDASVVRAKASKTAASASLGRANAQKKDANAKYKRAKSLAAKGLVAKAEVESAWASYQTAKAQVTVAWADLKQASAALDQANTTAAYATIVSPIDGVVISRDVDVGQTVAASLSAPTLFTIAENLTKMEIHTSVPESDVGKIAAGQRVTFTVDAYSSERFRGVVKQIRYSPKTESNVVTYDAVVTVENPDLKLRPGMTANVSFIVAQSRDAMLVPNAALRFQPSPAVVATSGGAQAAPESRRARPKRGDMTPEQRASWRKKMTANRTKTAKQRTVWIMSAGQTLTSVTVTVGITDGSVTEIVDGALKEGDMVIAGTGAGKATAGGAGARRPGQSGRRGGRMGGRFL